MWCLATSLSQKSLTSLDDWFMGSCCKWHTYAYIHVTYIMNPDVQIQAQILLRSFRLGGFWLGSFCMSVCVCVGFLSRSDMLIQLMARRCGCETGGLSGVYPISHPMTAGEVFLSGEWVDGFSSRRHRCQPQSISMPEHLKVIDLFPHTCVLWTLSFLCKLLDSKKNYDSLIESAWLRWGRYSHCAHWKSQDRKEPRKTRGCPRTTWPLIENQWPSWEFHIQLIWIHLTSTLRSPILYFWIPEIKWTLFVKNDFSTHD